MASTNSKTIFVTGASGFIGRHLLDRLSESGRYKILCLTRDTSAARAAVAAQDLEWVRGDLSDITAYSETLKATDTVIHLAAATGAANIDELRRVNELGARTLSQACKAAGVRRLLLMSSIAAKGSDLRDYPYAQSKLAAEKAVRESGVSHLILRPTIILAADAPNWPMLRKLSCLPIIPLFGGGRAIVQPVDLADVIGAIEWLIGNETPSGSVIELGGPETLTFAALLRRIRKACGKNGFPALSIPIGPTRVALKVLQRILKHRASLGPGQVAPFVNDGIADSNAVLDLLRPQMQTLDELLKRAVDDDRNG